MAKKICNHCGLPKDEEEFSWRFKALGIRNPACKDCQHAFNKDYYEGDAKEKHLQQVKERTEAACEAATEYVYQYLLRHPCEICGERDPIVLGFHHVGEKDMTVTRMVSGGWSIKRIQAELDKCQVLCASCHRRVTAKERGWYRDNKRNCSRQRMKLFGVRSYIAHEFLFSTSLISCIAESISIFMLCFSTTQRCALCLFRGTGGRDEVKPL